MVNAGSRREKERFINARTRAIPLLAAQRSLAPWMNRWSSLRMRLEEMVKDVQQSQHMFFISTIQLRLSNIFDNHVTNFFAAML